MFGMIDDVSLESLEQGALQHYSEPTATRAPT